MNQIKHVVYVMLENRSLDHVLGWLYETDSPQHIVTCGLRSGRTPKEPPPGESSAQYMGLQGHHYYNYDPTGTKKIPATSVQSGDLTTPNPNCGEDFEHVNNQLFAPNTPALGPLPGYSLPSKGTTPGMMGFCRDYGEVTSNAQAPQIMECYTPADLAVINGLAKGFAVSDEYFCSVPTHTRPNRAFAATGNSIGPYLEKSLAYSDNGHKGVHATFSQPTFWNVLYEAGKTSPTDWAIYYSNKDYDDVPPCFTRQLFRQLQSDKLDPFFLPVDDFFTACSSGLLPTFSFVEPAWDKSDYHPPYNLCPGELLLWQIYQALAANQEVWDSTLLIINFDEHGGTYDHVAPPWDDSIVPWSDSSDGTHRPDEFQHSFGYDRYGVRVPLILVSPWVAESTVFRASGPLPLDHTSVIATILDWFEVPRATWKLGSRVANAPTFADVLSQEKRTDLPQIPKPACSLEPSELPPTDLLRELLECQVNEQLALTGARLTERLQCAGTVRELKAAYVAVMHQLMN